MTPYTIEDFKNRRFDPSNSENFLGVSDSSDPNVNFFNSVSKKLTKYFSVLNATANLDFSEKDALPIEQKLSIRCFEQNTGTKTLIF